MNTHTFNDTPFGAHLREAYRQSGAIRFTPDITTKSLVQWVRPNQGLDAIPMLFDTFTEAWNAALDVHEEMRPLPPEPTTLIVYITDFWMMDGKVHYSRTLSVPPTADRLT